MSFSGQSFLFFIILFSSALFSQEKKLTPKQIDARLEKCSSYLIPSDFHSVLPCLEDLKPHLENSKYYSGMAGYYNILIDYYMLNGEHNKMLTLIDEALEKYENHFSEKEKNRFQLSELQILQIQGKNDEVLIRANELLHKLEDPRFRAALFSFRASAYMDIGVYDETLNDLYSALELFKSEEDIHNIITIYNRLGLLQMDLKEYEKALQLFEQAYEYALKDESESSSESVFTNLGVVQLEMGLVDEAILNFKKAGELAKRRNNPMDEARILLNLGDAYIHKNDYASALEYLIPSLKISKDEGIPIGVLYNYKSLGKVYLELGEFEKSLNSLDSAGYYARELQLPKMESEVFLGYYNLYEKKGEYKKALHYYVKNDSLNQILLSEDTKKSVADIEIKYQTELKRQELEKTQLELEKKLAQNRTLLIGISSAAVVIGFIVFFMFYRNRNLRKLYDRNMELLQTVKYYKISPHPTDDRDHLKKIFDRLMELINGKQIYKDPYLSIGNIAEMLDTNEKYVSLAISKYAHMNYNNFINFHRINEAKELIYLKESANMNEIMKASGFNSRTPFYNAFKKFTGFSPTQFKGMNSEFYSA